MNAFVIEFLGLLGRWVHLITGIAWIGASFYFVWLDDNLERMLPEALTRRGARRWHPGRLRGRPVAPGCSA